MIFFEKGENALAVKPMSRWKLDRKEKEIEEKATEEGKEKMIVLRCEFPTRLAASRRIESPFKKGKKLQKDPIIS